MKSTPAPDTSTRLKQIQSRPLAIVRRLVQLFALLALSLILFSMLGHSHLLAELVNSFRLQVSFALAAAAVMLWLLRRYWLASVSAVVAAWQILMLGCVFLPTQQPPAGTETLIVMAANVLTENQQFEQTIAHIRDVDPDVVLIIEYSDPWHQNIKSLTETYPHQLLQPRWHGYGMAILSKLPLESTDVWQLTSDQTDVPALVAHVAVGNQTIRLAGLHTMSPTSRLRLDLRNEQMEEMVRLLSESDEPTMLMGDFNCVPWSSFYRDMLTQSGYRDSRQGKGYLASWNTALPWPMWIPIDHALVSDKIHVHHRQIGQACGSDHVPTVIEISVSE